jgi:PAS domain S-box-containing protein
MNTCTFFDSFFNMAKQNAIMVMDEHGIVLRINDAFIDAFGYTESDIIDQNFRLTFIEKDRKMNRPEMELDNVKTNGFAEDDNYVLHKDGTPIWASGESILMNADGNVYIVKVIQNIQPQKQLERFLLESNEFIETIFDSIRDAALIILDSMMRVIKVNKAFSKFFEVNREIREGARLSDLGNPFLDSEELKKEVRRIIVTNESVRGKEWEIETSSGERSTISFDAKIIHAEPTLERKLLIVIREK